MAVADYLVDKSAVARLRIPAIKTVLDPLVAAGRVATCGMIDLEVLYSSRSGADHAATRARRGFEYEWLHTEDKDFRRAIEVQSALAESGRHRAASLPDLVIAAIAERHGATVLHYDADFDLISEVTDQPTRWVVPRGSLEDA